MSYLVISMKLGLMDGVYSEHSKDSALRVCDSLNERYPNAQYIVVEVLEGYDPFPLTDHLWHSNHREKDSHEKYMNEWKCWIEYVLETRAY